MQWDTVPEGFGARDSFIEHQKRVAGKQGMHGCLGDRGFPYKGNGSYFLGSGKVARPELKDGD